MSSRDIGALMASAEDRGLALWHAVLDATKRWPVTDDVMGVGIAGDEVVVIRVHCLDPHIFQREYIEEGRLYDDTYGYDDDTFGFARVGRDGGGAL